MSRLAVGICAAKSEAESISERGRLIIVGDAAVVLDSTPSLSQRCCTKSAAILGGMSLSERSGPHPRNAAAAITINTHKPQSY